MILVTGGAGYIGSHTCVALAGAKIEHVVLDNFCNSDRDALRRVSAITGYTPKLFDGDIRNEDLLRHIFSSCDIRSVIHFAGLKAIGESNAQPLNYFSNNVVGSLCVLQAMAIAGCRQLVFSSSATVYGDARTMPIMESAPCSVTNPYGRTKLVVEEMLSDLERSDASWQIARLRYFNPVGAHESGLLGERPNDVPNNLMPYVSQVAAGLRSSLSIFGGDYPTPDGTGVRDFIHVMDLAEGHVAALRRLQQRGHGMVLNLGTGKGTSVLQMVQAFEQASGRSVPYQVVERREGDVAICYADVTRSEQMLNWRAARNVDDMCRDAWRWQIGQAR